MKFAGKVHLVVADPDESFLEYFSEYIRDTEHSSIFVLKLFTSINTFKQFIEQNEKIDILLVHSDWTPHVISSKEKIPQHHVNTIISIIESSLDHSEITPTIYKYQPLDSFVTTVKKIFFGGETSLELIKGQNERSTEIISIYSAVGGSVVARANAGDTYKVVEVEGEWFKIELDNGTVAYVAGWIVSTKGLPSIERGLAKYLNGKTIVIDPGHGGRDSGATGSHFKTVEKIVNLEVSNLLKEKFEATGAKVIMTRSTDIFVSLQERVNISTREKADVFLSIHHNTNDDSRVNGTITYFYSNEDRILANAIQKEVVHHNGLRDLKARKGNFLVLRENPSPSVLIELGFLTNYNDELTIRTSKFQENSANGILHGVANYFRDK